jgi:hypothetical protein
MVTKLICKTPKHYQLTEGKVYEVVEFVNGETSVLLTNDLGVLKRYSMKLFEKEVSVDTLFDEIIKELNFKMPVTRPQGNSSVIYFEILGQPNNGLTLFRSQTSCSVKDIEGINSLIGRLRRLIDQYLDHNDKVKLLSANDRYELKSMLGTALADKINWTDIIQEIKAVTFYFVTTHYDKQDGEDVFGENFRNVLMKTLHSISTTRNENIKNIIRRTKNYSGQNLIALVIPNPIK